MKQQLTYDDCAIRYNHRMNSINFDYDIYGTIRKNIKKYRKERKMTAAQLAEIVDLSHDFIRQIESEKIAANFSVDTLYRISVALDVSIDALFAKPDDTP